MINFLDQHKYTSFRSSLYLKGYSSSLCSVKLVLQDGDHCYNGPSCHIKVLFCKRNPLFLFIFIAGVLFLIVMLRTVAQEVAEPISLQQVA